MKSGVENMLEVYFKDKKRTKDLESQLEGYNAAIDTTKKKIEHIRTVAGKKKGKQKDLRVNESDSSLCVLFFIYSEFRHKHH